MPEPHREHRAPLPPSLQQWLHDQPSAASSATLARAVLLALSDMHGLAPGALEHLCGSAKLDQQFWEPTCEYAAFVARLVPPAAHGVPASPPSETALRRLLHALCDERTAAALQTVRPEAFSALFEGILAAGRARRRAAGIFYTPRHVVEYIIDNTIVRALGGDASHGLPYVLDPACGAGAFLLPAYRVLADSRPHDALAPLTALYGVDIDPYAVAATRLALLLAMREAQPDRSTPDGELLEVIASRVVWGNTLRSPTDAPGSADALAWEETFPAALARGGFDAIIGNPPYLNVKRGALKRENEHLATHYTTARGQYDAFGLFVERTLGLLAPNGVQALVVPRPLLAAESYTPVRHLMLQHRIEAVIDAGVPFAGVGVEAAIVVVRKQQPANTAVRLERLGPGGSLLLGHTPQALFEELPAQALSFRLTEGTAALIRRLTRSPLRLADLATHLTRGLELGKHSAALSPNHRSGAQPVVRGEDLGRYTIRPPACWHLPPAPQPGRHGAADPAERLLIRRVSTRIEAALERSESVTLNTVYTLIPHQGIDPALLLGILNARLISYYLRVVYLSDDRLFPYLRRSQLAALPLPALPPEDEADQDRCRDIAAFARELQQLHTQMGNAPNDLLRETLAHRIARNEQQLDQLVYQLFELSAADIALVEAEER